MRRLYRKIALTQGQFALVDSEDYEAIARYKWCARWNPHTRTFYAYRNVWPKTPGSVIGMHREIMGLIPHDGKQVDHRKPDKTLDNRKKNLRVCTGSNNLANARKRRTNSSGFKGVSFHRMSRKWIAQITVNRKPIYLGLHQTARSAHGAYRTAAIKYFGEFARP